MFDIVSCFFLSWSPPANLICLKSELNVIIMTNDKKRAHDETFEFLEVCVNIYKLNTAYLYVDSTGDRKARESIYESLMEYLEDNEDILNKWFFDKEFTPLKQCEVSKAIMFNLNNEILPLFDEFKLNNSELADM